MTGHAERHRSAHDAFGRQDMDALAHVWDENIVWHVAGRAPLAGTYEGRDAVFGFFEQLAQATEGTFQYEDIDFTESGERSIAVTRISASRAGRSAETCMLDVARWRDGKIVEEWITVEDQYEWDDLFAA